jgi:hypothetical protein
LGIFHSSHTAAGLDTRSTFDSGHDPCDHLSIHWTITAGSVKVNDVNPTSAVIGKCLCHRVRIFAVHGFAPIVPLTQTDNLSSSEVYGRE